MRKEISLIFFHSNSFLPTINIPTRIQGSSIKILDHIWTNILYFKTGVVNSDITDHFPTFIIFPQPLTCKDSIDSYFRCHKQNNLDIFRNRIADFIDYFGTVDDFDCNNKTYIFCSKLYDIYDMSCPVKLKRISLKRATKPWLTNSILSSINHKHHLYREICSGRGNIVHYKKYRNVLTNVIRCSKKNYFRDKFSFNYGDSRSTWKIINQLVTIKQKQNNEIKVRNNAGQIMDDSVQVANEFNSYFSSVAKDLDSMIPRTNIDPLSYIDRLPNSFVLNNTDESEVLNIIKSFKSKGSHIKTIPPFVFKLIADLIAPIISNLINASFKEGIFPSILKLARIIPIFKKGSREIPSNYRPISTLHFISKIFEKVMDRRIRKFFDKYNILSKNQFGFRSKVSTVDAILKFTDCVYNSFNNNKYMFSIFLDLSKAFDTVRHDILINKLEYAGIRGRSLEWFKSYLTDRQQYVDINGSVSHTSTVDAGVPQGSTLGPLLFNLYINDMSKSTNNLQYIHFADDTTVYISNDSPDFLCHTLNSELCKLDQWLQSNRLSLNLDKTCYMIFSNRNKSITNPVKLRNYNVKLVNDTKFLGIIVDDNLSFCKHINYVAGKVSKTCGVLGRIRSFVPSSVFKTLYFSLVYPYIIYGLPVYGSGNMTPLKRLSSIQNKCIRYFPSENTDNILSTYKEHNLLPFNLVYKFTLLLKFYQYRSDPLYEYFNSKISNSCINHDHITRLNVTQGLILPPVTKSKCCRSFLFQSVKFWNNLPNQLREPMTLSQFKKKLRNHLITLIQ